LLLATLAFASACQRLDPGRSRQGQVALAFAQALSSGSYADARACLSETLAREWPVAKLQRTYEALVSDGRLGQVTAIEVTETMDDWPARRVDDVGWAYVALSGKTFSQGITVVVAEEHGRLVIRAIEWGSP
jgi:hypothetical protein